MIRRGLVLGCGGTVGGAWQVGALAAVEQHLGWDPRTAEAIVGTSAGATAAAMLGAGVGVGEMLAGQRGEPTARESLRRFFTSPPRPVPSIPAGLPSLPLSLAGLRRRALHPTLAGILPAGRTNPSFLDELIDDLVPGGGWVPHRATWIVATGLSSGDRTFFGSPTAPPMAIRDAVRASWAIPGWYPPVTIAGQRYIDGGVASTASADALIGAGLHEVIVVAPMASVGHATAGGLGGRVERGLRGPMSRVLDREAVALEAAGTRVVRVHPTSAELRLMGPNFMDPRRRLPALQAALEHVPARLGREPERVSH